MICLHPGSVIVHRAQGFLWCEMDSVKRACTAAEQFPVCSETEDPSASTLELTLVIRRGNTKQDDHEVVIRFTTRKFKR
jgi:hypothetical protein